MLVLVVYTTVYGQLTGSDKDTAFLARSAAINRELIGQDPSGLMVGKYRLTAQRQLSGA